ncbi:MAG: Type I restriction-modification system, specificity subunit S (EC [uncultured Sulfurovum sp.]|uniref:Type I restriction-modification system, specificity subunit S (EC) n=1 Tax=uncultured Sulfurovum sp. TaxID=269237 RepID=A0A6S6TPU0_9BACT|nr:MAG: Type I restriction-modification system, specificity subunit S (EC [uncultured Sulfurovum sp.]
MRVKLTSICTPKQYKTISKKDLIEDGEFVVYGANGIIGRANHYTHSDSMLLITCRGATCGQLNISEPYSYINGNAMTLDDLDKNVDLKYLYYQLLGNNFNNVITGSAQPQITKVSLEKLYVNVPPLSKQKTIAKTLDKAKELIELRKASIEKLDELSKSVFIDMFGDPVENPMGWEVVQIKEVITFLTSGSRGWAKYYSDEGEVFIRIQNVKNGSISFLKKQ